MILFTTDRRIRFAGLFKNCPAPASNFVKKAGWRYRTFAKKMINGFELSKKSWVALSNFFGNVRKTWPDEKTRS
jgi:hypothetical protein